MARLSATPLVLLLLGGCVTHTFAPGPGMSGADFEPESARCRLFARGADPGFAFGAFGSPSFVAATMVGGAIGGVIGSAVRENRNYNDCMQARGWRVADGVHTPTASPAAQREPTAAALAGQPARIPTGENVVGAGGAGLGREPLRLGVAEAHGADDGVAREPSDTSISALSKASRCSTSVPLTYAGGPPTQTTMRMSSSGGWCWIELWAVRGSLKYVPTYEVTHAPTNGAVLMGEVNQKARIAYKPMPGFAGDDSFVIAEAMTHNERPVIVTVAP
jgi:hypothetical protein